MSDLIRAVIALREEMADLKARQERMFRPGRVTDVDAQKHLYRQEIGTDPETGEPIKSPWIPVSQVAGGRKSHSLPSVGQGMMMISPDGDPAQAFGVPHHWSDANASPSTRADEDVDTRGSARDTTRGDQRLIEVGGASIDVKDGSIVIKVGGVTFTLSGDGAHFQGGAVKHDGKNIGATHTHNDVVRGSDITGTPT